MVKNIVHDTIFLAQKSEPATPADIQDIMDLMDTLKAHKDECVGMAANMIGVRKNIIAINTGFVQLLMVNAKIVKKSKPYETKEGCLSFLGGPVKTTRYDEIEVEYQDMNFKPKKEEFSGYTAQIIQHELDHVEGKLI